MPCPPTRRVHFALTCKALLRQYRQDEAAWLGGLHVSLACSGSTEGVAACEQQLQQLLQRLPPSSIASLSITQLDGHGGQASMVQIAGALRQGLRVLDLQLQPSYAAVEAQLDFPLLRCVSMEGTHQLKCTFTLQTPMLQSLTLTRCMLTGQLPQALTHLDLREVRLSGDAGPSIFEGAATLGVLRSDWRWAMKGGRLKVLHPTMVCACPCLCSYRDAVPAALPGAHDGGRAGLEAAGRTAAAHFPEPVICFKLSKA